MGKVVREHGADVDRVVDPLAAALVKQCATEARNTLYTSTSFYIWLRALRNARAALWVMAAIASTIAASSVVSKLSLSPVLLAGLTLAGVILPGIVKATKLDEAIEAYEAQAAAFKKAEAALGRAANVWSNKPIEEFEQEARAAQKLLDDARSVSLTPPELIFKWAQIKVRSGDYDPDDTQTMGFWRRLKWVFTGH